MSCGWKGHLRIEPPRVGAAKGQRPRFPKWSFGERSSGQSKTCVYMLYDVNTMFNHVFFTYLHYLYMFVGGKKTELTPMAWPCGQVTLISSMSFRNISRTIPNLGPMGSEKLDIQRVTQTIEKDIKIKISIYTINHKIANIETKVFHDVRCVSSGELGSQVLNGAFALI